MIIGVGLGIALAAGTAHADSTPLGKGVEKLAGSAKKVTDSVVKKKASSARPKAVRKPVKRPAAKPAKRVVRSPRPQAKPLRVAPKPRVRIPAPARKKVLAPTRTKINNSQPAKIVKKASAKINKRVAKKIDKPAAKKLDKPRKKINKVVTQAARPMPNPQSVDPATILLPDVDLPAVKLPDVKLPDVMLPSIELPAIELPTVELPTGELPPGLLPTVVPEVSVPPPVRSVPDSLLPNTRSADRPASPALDRVRPAPAESPTPALAATTPAHLVTSELFRPIATFAEETVAGVTPTSAGTSTALILAAVIGVAATSSANANTSGWAGMALLPAALHLSAVGVRRRFSAALRLSAWRIGYRPAFAPD